MNWKFNFKCFWPLAWTVVQCEGEGNEQPGEEQQHFSVVTIRQSQTLQAYYRLMDWLSLVLFNLAPILLLSVLNFQLVFTLRRIVRRDSSASAGTATTVAVTEERSGGVVVTNIILEDGHAQQQQQRLNANAMLFAVVLLLFVCIGPQVPARLLYEWHGHYYDTGAVLYTCISQQLVFLNASLNFCLYCLVSRRYRALLRDTVLRLLRHCHPRPSRWQQRNGVAKFAHRCHRRRRSQQQSTSSSTGCSSRGEEQQQQQRGRTVTVPLLEINGANRTPTDGQ
ncbi:hypothetical protein niasHS_013149 [Heterodera schachtii]|uniref:G-protein coupled receptors family 1 profile domain-containing protein n=1 Tax=Heterodera schachtii TaxID=97005 RepID=A0ABD2IHX8_HETSC